MKNPIKIPMTVTASTAEIRMTTTADRVSIPLTASVGGAGGTGDHTKLKNRDAADQHPISAITGLQDALDEKAGLASLSPVALTGNIEDLTQEDAFFMLQCGNASGQEE